MLPYQSKLAPELRSVAGRGRRVPSVIVPSAEGVPAMTTVESEEWRDATDELFEQSEEIAARHAREQQAEAGP
jgi:hypothetical protein